MIVFSKYIKLNEKEERKKREKIKKKILFKTHLLTVRCNYNIHFVLMFTMLRDLRVNFPSVIRQIDLLAGHEACAGDGTEAWSDQVAIRVFGAGTWRTTAGYGIEAYGITSLRCNTEAWLGRGWRRRFYGVNDATIIFPVFPGSTHSGADYATFRQPLTRRHYSWLFMDKRSFRSLY